MPPLVFRGLETLRLLQLRAWLAPVFRGLETIRLLQLRAWRVPARHDQGKVSALAGPMTVALVLVLPSSSAPEAPVALQVQDLVDQVQAAQVVLAPVVLVVLAVPVAVPVLVVAVAVPVEVPLVPSVAVAERVSPASPSAQSVKSLKCGRRQA